MSSLGTSTLKAGHVTISLYSLCCVYQLQSIRTADSQMRWMGSRPSTQEGLLQWKVTCLNDSVVTVL